MPIHDKKKGIALILASSFCFSAMGVFARLAGDVPAMEKTFFRNLVSVIVIVLLLMKQGKKIRITKDRFPLHMMRSGFGTLCVVLNFYAMDRMVLSDFSTISNLCPFFVIIFSALILREKASGKQWLLIAVAMVGTLFVVKPSPAIFQNPAAILALIGAAGGGMAYTMVRLLQQKGEEGTIIVFVFSMFSCVVCLPSVLMNPVPLTMQQFIYLLLAAICACGGQFAVTGASRYAPGSEISIFDYSQILFAAILGFVVFKEIADIWSYVGYVIIFVAAFLVYLEGKKQ